MKPYVVTAKDGRELGRLVARSQDEAEERAAEFWPGQIFTVKGLSR